MSARRLLRCYFTLLLVATAAALLWNHYGMRVSLVVDAGTGLRVIAVDDHDTDAGHSRSALFRRPGEIDLQCDIAEGYQWPYCEVEVLLAPGHQGVDLSRFDTLRLKLRADGPEGAQRVRVFLLNDDPAYTKADDDQSLKVNEIVYDPGRYPDGLEVPLQRFTVAGWWLNEHPLDLPKSGLQIDHVTRFVLNTGVIVQPGRHHIVFERAEFVGKRVSTETFRLGIIGVWMASVLAWLMADAVAARRRLRETARRNDTLSKRSRELAALAARDPLTGVLNRHGLEEALAGTTVLRGDYAVIFMDLDRFKAVNDTHGHEVGDDVLREFVARVTRDVQRDDLVARWGGEEFLLVCPGTPLVEAEGVAERLRLDLREPPAWPAGLAVTASFGVAQVRAGEAFEDVVRRADAALYRAKQKGRDRVELD